MQVLFLTRKWPPAVGGMEVYSAEMAAEMQSAGHRVDLRALPGRADGRAPRGPALVRFGLGTGLSVLLRPRRWDVLLGGDLAIWPLVWLAALRRPDAAPILAAHGTDAGFGARPGLRPALYRAYLGLGARLLRRARVAANSATTADHARAAGFSDITVIPLGVRPVAPLGAPPDGPYLLFAGRRVRRKGLSWFVAQVLPRLSVDLRVLVVGPPWDPAEEAALCAPRVKRLDALAQPRLFALMRGATAVVIPNLPAEAGVVEGFGLIAAEAAAQGAVVLAAAVDGYESSVVDGTTGLLLPPGDAAAWAAAIADVQGWTPERRVAFTDRARLVARSRFDWARTARATLGLAAGGGTRGRGSGRERPRLIPPGRPGTAPGRGVQVPRIWRT
jgi:phosphatidylinositol alpha-1,6-mannosyltransferase